MFHFLSKERRRKRVLATAVMGTLSVLWITGSILSFCVLVVSAVVHGRAGGQYYELLTHQLPTVWSTLAVWALITFPVGTLIGFIIGWPYLHDDDYRRAIGFNMIPGLNLIALWMDHLIWPLTK